MKKSFRIFTLFGLFFIVLPKSFGNLHFPEKEPILVDSTYRDLSKLRFNDQRLICEIETNKPYSGKVAGWLVIGNRKFHIANIGHFGLSFYGSEGGIHSLSKDERELFLIGKVKRGKEVNTWYYYSTDGTLGAKAHFKKGLLEGKAEIYYENGRIERIEEYKSGKLDGKVIRYDENGNIIQKTLYRKGSFINDLFEKD